MARGSLGAGDVGPHYNSLDLYQGGSAGIVKNNSMSNNSALREGGLILLSLGVWHIAKLN